MCIIYNTIGALSNVEYHLNKNNIHEFKTISELINFENDFYFNKQQTILKHKLFIQNERKALEEEIPQVSEEITKYKFDQNEKLKQKLNDLNKKIDKLFLPNSKFVTIIKDSILSIIIWPKIWSSPTLTKINIFVSTQKKSKYLIQKKNRYEFINKDFEEAVNQSSSSELQELVRKKNLINEIKNFIYGALGEHKVESTLSKLSDEYILINDFKCSFQPALFYSKEKEYIKSVQIDHILISPSGVFLIETKNWSEHSIENTNLRSPIQQVKRVNFALFKILLNNKLRNHHWGERKIPIRNIITFINNKPIAEFQFVKILSLNELVKYITYFPPCFSKEEVEYIANFLLNFCEEKNDSCKLSI